MFVVIIFGVINKRNPCPTKSTFEEKEDLLNNIDHFIDAANYQKSNNCI